MLKRREETLPLKWKQRFEQLGALGPKLVIATSEWSRENCVGVMWLQPGGSECGLMKYFDLQLSAPPEKLKTELFEEVWKALKNPKACLYCGAEPNEFNEGHALVKGTRCPANGSMQ